VVAPPDRFWNHPGMRLLTFSGSPADIGEAFGESCRDEIQTFYELRLGIAVAQTLDWGGRSVGEPDLLAAARASIAATQAYDPSGWEELCGIAHGANMSPEKVLALNGLTDFRDVLSWHGDFETFGGCSSFIVQGDGSADGGVLVGQTWDLATNNMPYVLGIHRKPDNGPETWTLTTVGCLSLIGMNEHGISVGTTNVRTPDARPGVVYLSIIHKALGARDLDSAARAVIDAQRSGAHFYWLADATGRATAIECTAQTADRHDVDAGVYVHCNHCVVPSHVAIEPRPPSPSSSYRSSRLQSLLEAGSGTHDLETVKAALADEEGGNNAICRDDTGGISTNGAVVIAPERREIHACQGLPSRTTWRVLRASD
jgi:isopenicillin-N N-acyltransferase like protein